jgi:hypothetical protein
MNYRDTIGYEREAIPAMNLDPATADSIVALCKAALERIGATPADPDDSLLTVAGQRDTAATNDDMSDIATTNLSAKIRLVLNRLSTNAFTATVDGAACTQVDTMVAALADYVATNGAAMSATVDPGGTARSDLETILEDLGKVLCGGGITTYPAAAVPGNGISMAAGIRGISSALSVVAAGAGTGFEVDGAPGLVDALGTTGATVNDSATSVLGAIGANNANNAFDSSSVLADDDGSVLERLEFVQTQTGYGVRELIEDTGGSTTVITSAAEITEAAGWWKNALVLGITGNNIGVCRPIVSNTVDTVTVYPALRAAHAIGDKFLLISAYKPQNPEMQADVPFTDAAVGVAGSDIFDLTVDGYSYIVHSLLVKSANPGVDTITVRLYQLVNDVEQLIASRQITTVNFGTYFSLMDLFGTPQLAGDNIRVNVVASANTYAVTAQYSYSVVYTGAG